jgi:[protein-PII] uridylyltransferase
MDHFLPLPGYLESSLEWNACEHDAENPVPIQSFTRCLKKAGKLLTEAFQRGEDIEGIIQGRAALVDRVLAMGWKRFGLDQANASLVAVGGYGRGELHPASDIDLLILFKDEPSGSECENISDFLTFLWDIKFQVGHSVRTLEECIREASEDITIATNVMEARLLCGDEKIFESMQIHTSPDQIWHSPEFFAAKLEEQIKRHERFGETAYKVEPNLKEGPGGLRDIQMIGWVTKRHFGARSLAELVAHGFLLQSEYDELLEGQRFLWQIRFALHELSGRKEERLLFDFQKELARQFGYEDEEHNLGVELFMQRYYRTIMSLERLNEMLLQHYDEALLQADKPVEIDTINRRFQVRNGYIETIDSQIFAFYPPALLEIFLILQANPEIRGVRAGTIRSIRSHLHLIDRYFRNDIRTRSLFMEILRQATGITQQFRRMNRYGVLAAYLPSFANIVGRMQYDLFHVYTVDEHILMVLRNVRRMGVDQFEDELPMCHRVFRTLPKPELLYVAALFHDIAKGRGGDHSVLGAIDAEQFCLQHDLSIADTKLVSWLVAHHLTMSMFAQQKDINDPDVVHEFAGLMGNTQRLDYLFLLTVADMRGTNPELWNSWKYSLLTTLHQKTKKVLRRGLSTPEAHDEIIESIQADASTILIRSGLSTTRTQEVWADFDNEYFLRHSPEDIAWHTRLVAHLDPTQLPLIAARHVERSGSTEIFIYGHDGENLFTRITHALERMNLNILDARIQSTHSGKIVDTLHVHDLSGEAIAGSAALDDLCDRLKQELDHDTTPQRQPQLRSRQHKHFDVKTRLYFSHDEGRNMTIMELITGDRLGLLSIVSSALLKFGIALHVARISTIGEEADDVFYMTANGQPLSEGTRDALKESLIRALSDDQ